MALENLYGRDNKLIDAAVASANKTSDGKEVARQRSCSVQVIWSALTGTKDGTVKLQESNDNANWIDIPSATVNVNSTAGTDMIRVTDLTAEFVRAVYTKNSIAGGAITAILHAKG